MIFLGRFLPCQQVNTQLEQKEEERKATQNELDDLLIVFSDLEDKVTRYRVGSLCLVDMYLLHANSGYRIDSSHWAKPCPMAKMTTRKKPVMMTKNRDRDKNKI